MALIACKIVMDDNERKNEKEKKPLLDEIKEKDEIIERTKI